MAANVINDKEKIEIMMKEHAALRDEILARSNQQFQLVTIASVAITWLIAQRIRTAVFWPLLISLTAVFANSWWILQVVIWRCGHRVKEIERKVNAIAGDDLLRWESYWAGVQCGSYRIIPPGAKESEPSTDDVRHSPHVNPPRTAADEVNSTLL